MALVLHGKNTSDINHEILLGLQGPQVLIHGKLWDWANSLHQACLSILNSVLRSKATWVLYSLKEQDSFSSKALQLQ